MKFFIFYLLRTEDLKQKQILLLQGETERWMTRQTFWLDLLSNQVGWAWLLIDLRYSFPAKSIIFHWATSTNNPNIKTVGDPCCVNIGNFFQIHEELPTTEQVFNKLIHCSAEMTACWTVLFISPPPLVVTAVTMESFRFKQQTNWQT